MYTARLLFKIAGNPGYGQGDILNSRTPQVRHCVRLCVQSRLRTISVRFGQTLSIAPTAKAVAKRLTAGSSQAVSTISRPTKWISSRSIRDGPFQSEGYYRHQRVRNTDSGTVPFDLSTIPAPQFPRPSRRTWPSLGMVRRRSGKYIIPRKFELAFRIRHSWIRPPNRSGRSDQRIRRRHQL